MHLSGLSALPLPRMRTAEAAMGANRATSTSHLSELHYHLALPLTEYQHWLNDSQAPLSEPFLPG